MIVTFKKVHPGAKIPSKAHPTDAAFDISTIEAYTLAPGERHLFSTGIAASFPADYVALFRDRSSLGSKGLTILAGVIDASYRGEWKVVLLNTSNEPYDIKTGDRIAQCLFLPVPEVQVEEVNDLPVSDRATGGFGSTGR